MFERNTFWVKLVFICAAIEGSLFFRLFFRCSIPLWLSVVIKKIKTIRLLIINEGGVIILH